MKTIAKYREDINALMAVTRAKGIIPDKTNQPVSWKDKWSLAAPCSRLHHIFALRSRVTQKTPHGQAARPTRAKLAVHIITQAHQQADYQDTGQHFLIRHAANYTVEAFKGSYNPPEIPFQI